MVFRGKFYQANGGDSWRVSGNGGRKPHRNRLPVRWLSGCVLAVFLLVTACRRITTTTIMHRDGTLDRIITVTGDSSEVFAHQLPIPGDSSWKVIRQGKTGTKSAPYVYSIQKHFQSAEQLNRNFGAVPADSTRPARTLEFTEVSRWFYTDLTYRETYPRWNQYVFIPLHAYFNDQELRDIEHALRQEEPDRVLSGQDSLYMENKINAWIGKNVFEAIYLTLGEFATDSPGAGLDPDRLTAAEDSVWAVVQDSLRSAKSPYPGAAMIAGVAGRVLGQPAAVAQLYRAHRARFDTTEKVMQLFSRVREIPDYLKQIGLQNPPEYTHNDSNAVTMPGKILDTNAETIQDNTVGWETGPEYYFVNNYVMWVKSRVVNLWALILTGLFLVAFITGIVEALTRRRDQG